MEDDEIPNNYKRQQQLREAGLILTGIQEEEEHDDDDAIDDEPGSIRYTDVSFEPILSFVFQLQNYSPHLLQAIVKYKIYDHLLTVKFLSSNALFS